MRIRFVEATNRERNWGKFMLSAWEEGDLIYPSAITGQPLIREVGDHRRALWVMDIQTGEGARFYPVPRGVARADLDKHKIWVCPLFQPFLEWLYAHQVDGASDWSQIPALVQLPDAPAEFRGYRRPGHAPKKRKRGPSKVWTSNQ